jgi:ABC-2 type transport system permease protein
MNNIGKLIRLEWLKFNRHRGIRFAVILFALIFPAGFFAFRRIAEVNSNPMLNLLGLTEFPEIWNLHAYVNNWLAFFIFGFIGVQIIAIEFENKTFRQNIISGLTRIEFFKSKILTIGIVSFIGTLIYLFWTITLGFVYSESGEMMLELDWWNVLGRVFLTNIGYMSIGMFFGFLFRRGSTAVFIYLLYGMFLENIIRWWLHYKVAPNISMHFYPMNGLEDLTPMPMFSNLAKMNELGFDPFLSPGYAITSVLVYSSIFFLISYRLATRKDI